MTSDLTKPFLELADEGEEMGIDNEFYRAIRTLAAMLEKCRSQRDSLLRSGWTTMGGEIIRKRNDAELRAIAEGTNEHSMPGM